MPAQSKYASQRQEIRTLYTDGLSVTQIAILLGVGRGVVQWFCRDIMRPRWIGIRVRRPRTSCKPDACRKVARTLVERMLGYKLPRRVHVHHIDGDYTNNRLGNLQVIDVGDHVRLHAKLRQRKTHCPQGHPYAGTNLKRKKNGQYTCRACANAYAREYQRTHKRSRRAASR